MFLSLQIHLVLRQGENRNGNMLMVSVSALTADGLAVVLIVHIGRQYIKRGLQIIMTYVKIKNAT